MLESSENRKFMLYSKRADQEPKEPKKPKEIGFRFLQLQVGDEVPDFRADSTVGEFGYHDMIDGVWSVLVTFPPDAEAVATTEWASSRSSTASSKRATVASWACPARRRNSTGRGSKQWKK